MERVFGRTIGERIKLLRESKGLTQEDLAKEFCLAHGGVVSNYEKDKRKMPTDLVVSYSKKFKVTTDWILKGENRVS